MNSYPRIESFSFFPEESLEEKVSYPAVEDEEDCPAGGWPAGCSTFQGSGAIRRSTQRDPEKGPPFDGR